MRSEANRLLLMAEGGLDELLDGSLYVCRLKRIRSPDEGREPGDLVPWAREQVLVENEESAPAPRMLEGTACVFEPEVEALPERVGHPTLHPGHAGERPRSLPWIAEANDVT